MRPASKGGNLTPHPQPHSSVHRRPPHRIDRQIALFVVIGAWGTMGCSTDEAGESDGGADATLDGMRDARDASVRDAYDGPHSLPDGGVGGDADSGPARFGLDGGTRISVGGGLCASGFCWENPLPHGASLNAMTGTPSGEIWAVGPAGLAVVQQSGGAWQFRSTTVDTTLLGVWAESPASVWAVGYGGTILHWNGATWSAVSSGTTDILQSVWGASASDIWAVGGPGLSGSVHHFDGNAWSSVPAPASALLSSVHGTAPNRAWAVGEGGETLFWNGAAWSLESGFTNDWLGMVWAYDGGAWAAGNSSLGRYRAPGGWSSEAPDSGVLSSLRGVVGTGERAWAVGETALLSVGPQGISAADAGVPVSELGPAHSGGGVWQRSPNDVWIYGRSGVHAHFDGATWSSPWRGLLGDLMSVSASGPNDVWAVGINGAMRHFDGTAWVGITVSGMMFTSVWAASASEAWALGWRAGPETVIWRWDGSVWSEHFASVAPNLVAIHGSSPANIWAVGEQGRALHYDGVAWSEASTGTTEHLSAIWVDGAGSAWAVGRAGTAVRWDGSAWSPSSTGTTVALAAVWGASSGDVWAAGSAGTLLHFDGGSWTPHPMATKQSFYALAGDGPNDVWAAGGANTLFHWEGHGWARVTAPASNTYYGVWCGAGHTFVVGEQGAILHEAP